ncbi:MAG: hypothetical protein ACP5M1_05490 [Acidiphilium sp.]
MHVIAFARGCDDFANIFAVFDGGIVWREIPQRHFMSDGNIGIGDQLKIGIGFRDYTKHLGAGFQAFNNHNANIVLRVVDQQMRDTHQALSFSTNERL